jgi:hypothetical protein
MAGHKRIEPARAVSYLKTIKRNDPITKEVILTDVDREWPLATKRFQVSFDYQKNH